MNEHVDIVDFGKALFLRPKIFFQKYFNEYTQPSFFPVVLSVFCIAYGIGRLDYMLKPGGFGDHWLSFWGIAIAAGALGGYLVYLIAGWFYNVRLTWSEGTSDISTSRNLYLYTGSISAVGVIISTLVNFLVKENPSDHVSIYYSLATIFFLMFFSFYSIIISFYGVVTITNADHKKARIWFLIVPMVCYAIVYFRILWSLFSYLQD